MYIIHVVQSDEKFFSCLKSYCSYLFYMFSVTFLYQMSKRRKIKAKSALYCASWLYSFYAALCIQYAMKKWIIRVKTGLENEYFNFSE